MKKIYCFIITLFWLLSAKANLNVESGCYVVIPEKNEKKVSFFFIRTYYDEQIQERIGALLNYNNSKEHIALVFFDEIQEESATTDYRRIWLEVVGKKVTGQYVEYGAYSGNGGGRHIKYTNFRTNKVATFRIAMIDAPCASSR